MITAKNIIVIVLYGKNVSDSPSLQYLRNSSKWRESFTLTVVNNNTSRTIESTDWFKAVNCTSNTYLSGAYNIALSEAITENSEWILLLDDDTILNEQFEREITLSTSTSNRVSLVLPFITSTNGTFLSPRTYNTTLGFTWGVKEVREPGIYNKCFLGFNSGALIRTSAIKEAGGFPTEFPLDYLDYAYMYNMFKHGARTKVIDATLTQNLSLSDLTTMSVQRYKSILNAELRFSTILGPVANILWRVRLLPRALKMLFRHGGARLVPQTLTYIFKR